VFSDKLSYDSVLNNDSFTLSDRKPHTDVSRWYVKDNKELQVKFSQLIQLDRESFNKYHTNHYCSISEVAMIVGWILGLGTAKSVPNIKKLSKNFSFMYMIYTDLINLDNDFVSSSQYTHNYVINYGLKESFEKYMDNKQRFIEDCMINNIYTHTVREIVEYIDTCVEKVMDNTSPDIRSHYSSYA
jgi:hypothetical protein